MSFATMSYAEIKEMFLSDPSVRFVTKEAFKHFDNMDPVKALNDIENIKFIINKKLTATLFTDSNRE